MNLNLLDLALLIWILYYVIRGFFGGLIRMTLELAGLLVSVAVASAFYQELTALVAPLFLGFRTLAAFFSYIVIYVAVYQLFVYLIKWLDESYWKNNPVHFIERIRTVSNGLIERMGGLLTGLLKGNIVTGVVIILLTRFPVVKWFEQLLASSLLANYIIKLASMLVPNLLVEIGT